MPVREKSRTGVCASARSAYGYVRESANICAVLSRRRRGRRCSSDPSGARTARQKSRGDRYWLRQSATNVTGASGRPGSASQRRRRGRISVLRGPFFVSRARGKADSAAKSAKQRAAAAFSPCVGRRRENLSASACSVRRLLSTRSTRSTDMPGGSRGARRAATSRGASTLCSVRANHSALLSTPTGRARPKESRGSGWKP